MNKEDQSLLFKDLCARLPYGVIVQVKDWTTLDAELKTGHIRLLQEDKIELKPYLRSMDDMTEEEKHEYNTLAMHTIVTSKGFVHSEATDLIDWLNAHHFDYRGLIEKNLAIAVTKENNPYET